MVHIDGSYGEGGGQILRTSLTVAAITGLPVEIANLRAGRSKPGLQAQHLAAVRAAASLCAARLEGDAVGSMRLRFEPTVPVSSGAYRFEIGTAGAAPLVAQTVAAALALQPVESHVAVVGGTHVPHAPTADYLSSVYLPALAPFGIEASLEYERAGFFPKGGGSVALRLAGRTGEAAFAPVTYVERGKLRQLTAHVVTANLPDHVSDRGAAAVEQYLKGVGRKAEIVVRRIPALDPGAAVLLSANCEGGLGGFSALGERGKPMERVATEACEAFMAWWKSGAAVDEHLADQLVLPAALAVGESRWTTPVVTEHVRTVLWVVRQFLPVDISVEEPPAGPATVVVRPAERQRHAQAAI